MKLTKKIRLIELFAGIGAQAKALENLGVDFEHYRAVEFDKYAVQSYNAIHGTNFATSDITQIHADDLAIVNTNKYDYLMTYSFPCQDLSNAGKQAGMTKGSGTRSGLLWEVERLLNECDELPQVLLMENVPQVHGAKNRADFEKWCSFLQSKGYKNYWHDLNAKDYGVAQNRKRCYMVSTLYDDAFLFPQPIKLEKRLRDYLDEKYYLNKKWHFTQAGEQRHDENEIAQVDEISYKATRSITDPNKICRCLDTMGGGQREPKIIDKPICLNSKGGRGGVAGLQPSVQDRVYSSEGTSTAITTAYRPSITDDYRVRKLTPLECWRLMGFNDEDCQKARLLVSNSQLYKQAGNSIVVDVLMAIFKNMF